MSSSRTHALLLWCAATDATWDLVDVRGEPALAGRCIHCNTRLVLALDGTPVSRATLEHIVPRHHGGTDALENLALACARCNAGKGIRHDAQRWDDPTLQAVIATLQRRRAERMRAPLEALALPPRPEPVAQRTRAAREAAPAPTSRGHRRGAHRARR